MRIHVSKLRRGNNGTQSVCPAVDLLFDYLLFVNVQLILRVLFN